MLLILWKNGEKFYKEDRKKIRIKEGRVGGRC